MWLKYKPLIKDLLVPHLKWFFDALGKGESLGPALNIVYISGVPIPQKDSSTVEKDRPISLINNQLKLLTKITAKNSPTLSTFTFIRIGLGSYQERQGPDQVRRAVDVISLLQSPWDRQWFAEGLRFGILAIFVCYVTGLGVRSVFLGVFGLLGVIY